MQDMVYPHQFLLSLGRQQIILRMPWLKSQNPRINWQANTLSFPQSFTPTHDDPITPQCYLLCWLGLAVDQELSYLDSQRYSSGDGVPPSECLPQMTEYINSVTTGCDPDWCKDFEDVFSEKTVDHLPPHRSYDHTIELKPSFVPRVTKVYALNPAE
jgi:hypothetical protein